MPIIRLFAYMAASAIGALLSAVAAFYVTAMMGAGILTSIAIYLFLSLIGFPFLIACLTIEESRRGMQRAKKFFYASCAMVSLLFGLIPVTIFFAIMFISHDVEEIEEPTY